MRHARLFVPLAVALATLAGGCSDDPPAPLPSLLVGTWDATSISAFGQDLIAQGMTLSVTFASNGNFTIEVTGDLTGQCDPGPDCTLTGTYTSTPTTVTVDPNTDPTAADQLTFNYFIQGVTLMLTGSIQGIPVSITATKV